MNLDSNALATILHNQTVLQGKCDGAEFRLPLPGMSRLGQSSGVQIVEAAIALSDLADACRAQQEFLTTLAEALRQNGKGPVLEIVKKPERD